MDVDADLQNSVQNPLQQGVQANPPGDPSPPAIPANSVTPHPPPASDTDGIDARRLRSDILRALRFEYLLLDPLSLSNARFFSQQDIWTHT